jgi:citrate lyase subunit beta / citryl-CoA lyase
MPAGPHHPALPPRSYLFVPGDRPERFAKALASAADAVVLDLEDAVAPAAKAAARQSVAEFLARAGAQAARCVVRINDEASAGFADDLALLKGCAVVAVMCPKAERVETLQQLHAALPDAGLLALIESARGVRAADVLAAAPGVQRLVFGTLDYALDMDLQGPAAMTLGLDHAAARIALASRAAGLPGPVAGVTPALDDEALLRADIERARAFGFAAKLCIHPRQVAVLHAALAPSDDELAWAHRVLQAAEGAHGAVQLDGRMIDRPVIEKARRVLQRAPDISND